MPSHRRKNVAHQPTTRSNIPKEKKKLLVLSYLIKLGKTIEQIKIRLEHMHKKLHSKEGILK
jgi:hypothetical protein